MSTYISSENLGHSFHDKWLFRQLTFGINRGKRVALVGANGAGKSTLLKLLAGQLNPIEGKVVRIKDLKLGYLEQDPLFKKGDTISDFIFQSDNIQQQIIRRYEEMLENDPDNQKAIEEITEEITNNNAWEYEHNIKTILSRLDIHEFDQKIDTLSGGQKKRLALAQLLILEPEIYVLDEPTNHLDIDTIEWLESLLTEGNKTILLVTHDRYFLDNVCNEIIEIDKGRIFKYNGNYGYFLEKKFERETVDVLQFQKNSNLLKKELEWMRRQPQARGTKSKSRIDAYYELEDKTKNAGPDEKVELSIKSARQGNKVMEINNLSIGFNNRKLIEKFNYIFKKGDRIGLAGKNGSGKSTFLNILTGDLQPGSGSIDKGETTVIGYFHQGGIIFNDDERVIDVVKNVAEFIVMADGKTISASNLLTQFLFPPAKQYGLISNLSGGEKKRLQLMHILMKNPNFLILDEPTNDLDIDTLNVLEEFLIKYSGVLVLVTHDRYLLDKLTDQLFILEGNGMIKIYNGNYSSYRMEAADAKSASKKNNGIEQKTLLSNTSKSNYKIEKEIKELETVISNLEDDIGEINTKFSNSTNHVELKLLSNKLIQLKQILEEKTTRWLELSIK